MKQLLILLCILLPLYSQEGRGNRPTLRETLELNEEQVQKLSELRKEHRIATQNLNRELKELRTQLFDEYTDSEKVAALAKKTGEIHVALTKKMADHVGQIAEVLSREQFQKFIRLKSSNKRHKK
jgi:Spy/CpxP family protein refolding chaperone